MSERCTGLDQRGNRLLVATTSLESGRLVIERLEEVVSPDSVARWLADGARVCLAVSDLHTMVKMVRLSDAGAIELEERLKFELIEALLEDTETFQFDHVVTGLPERHLGFIWRREHLEDLKQRLGLTVETDSPRLSYRARSVALGRGYLAVCDGRDDSLMVLVDLVGESASLCYLYNRHVVDVATMSLAGHDLASESGRRRFGVDLRTLMNYKQSTLLDAGVSVPLSGLRLIGEPVDDAMLAAVRESFPVEVSIPQPHEGFFGTLDPVARRSLPLYLTALGLTVN